MFLKGLLLTALTIAAIAAFFSVYGLAHIYTSAFLSVIVMASALEIGKLVSVSFLYRYWESLRWHMKIYLFSAIGVLMLITSAGIFGYLSNAYQQDSVNLKDVNAKIELLNAEKIELDNREKQIDEDIGRVASNYITKRMELMEKYKPEKDYLTERRKQIRSELYDLTSEQLQVEAHTGPIIYIAKAFDKDVDTAILWMTLLIIFVFDPLAVVLTLGYNIAVVQHSKTKPNDHTTPPDDDAYVDDYEDDDLRSDIPLEVETNSQSVSHSLWFNDELADEQEEHSSIEAEPAMPPSVPQAPQSRPNRPQTGYTNSLSAHAVDEPIPTVKTTSDLSARLRGLKE